MRELSVYEVKEVNGGKSFFYQLGYMIGGYISSASPGDVDCNVAP